MYEALGGHLHYSRSRFDEERSPRYRRGKHGRLGIYWLSDPVKETLTGKANIEYHLGRKQVYLLGASVGVRDDEDPVSMSLHFWPMSLYASFETRRTKAFAKRFTGWRTGEDRELSVTFGGSDRTVLRWSLWMSDSEWRGDDPKWRRGWLSLVEVVLGKRQFRWEPKSTTDVLVPMPERSYPATVELRDHVSWYKRLPFFETRMGHANIEIPGGIGHPGKGENAWDCGDDATYAMGCPADTVEDAVGKVVASVLRDRKRYGGTYEFTPSLPQPDELRPALKAVG